MLRHVRKNMDQLDCVFLLFVGVSEGVSAEAGSPWLGWVRVWLEGWAQRAVVNGAKSSW